MSTSTIESTKTLFRLAYAHSANHRILNDQSSSFVWDGLGPTGTLNGVVKCAGGGVNVDMTQNGNLWTGTYCEDGQTFTLGISNFTHDEGRITGNIKRCHPSEGVIGGDDMGSFTGTKT